MKVFTSKRRPASAALTTTGLTAVLVAALALVPASASQADPADPAAQPGCLTADYRAQHWSSGDAGGFVAELTLDNRCAEPTTGWSVQLTLPPGHTLTHGWNAHWTSSGSLLTATDLPWNREIRPGGATTIGFAGAWTGGYQDPLDCTVNGTACDGGPGGNQPPVVTITRPASSTLAFISPCLTYLIADAHDPDGAIDRVEFYINDVLVGTADAAPYRVGIRVTDLPRPTGSPPGYTLIARAYDTATPPLSSDSEPRTLALAVGDPAPNTIYPCLHEWELPAGSSQEVRFGVFSYTTTEVTLTVTGDPGITVSPTTATVTGGAVDVTVTADPDSAGATATVTVTGDNLRPAAMSITVRPPG